MHKSSSDNRNRFSATSRSMGQETAPKPQARFNKFKADERRASPASATQRFVPGVTSPRPQSYATVPSNAMLWAFEFKLATPAAIKSSPAPVPIDIYILRTTTMRWKDRLPRANRRTAW